MLGEQLHGCSELRANAVDRAGARIYGYDHVVVILNLTMASLLCPKESYFTTISSACGGVVAYSAISTRNSKRDLNTTML